MSDEQESSRDHSSQITNHVVNRQQLRLSMRQRRKAVPQATRRSAAIAIAHHLRTQLLHPNQRIAVYSAFDGEIDLAHVLQLAKRARCALYAPRITNMRTRKMEFIALPRHNDVTREQKPSGIIREPKTTLHRSINPRLLDIVLIPVVAFDRNGWRLGFGAGFYDRKFAFMRRGFKKKPLLIGVGYEFQRVANQKPSNWDVLLDAIVTERGMQRCKKT